MGTSPYVDYERFPKQGEHLNMRVEVIFNFASKKIEGEVIRDDLEGPMLTIIRLDDGRIILGTECQYGPKS